MACSVSPPKLADIGCAFNSLLRSALPFLLHPFGIPKHDGPVDLHFHVQLPRQSRAWLTPGRIHSSWLHKPVSDASDESAGTSFCPAWWGCPGSVCPWESPPVDFLSV